MKNAKKLFTMLFAFAVLMGCMLLTTVDAQAAPTHTFKYDAKKGVAFQSRLRVNPFSRHEGSEIYLENANYYVASVKCNKAGLIAKVTYDNKITADATSFAVSEVSDARFKRNVKIGYYATKKGKYTVTATIKNAAGKKVCSKKITVYAGYPTCSTKTLSYGGLKYNTDGSISIQTKKASGKLKFVANSGYKIKKIEVATSHDAEGNPIFKKVRNGQKIKLAKETKYNDTWYSSERTNSGISYDYLKPVTIIKVTYYDKLLKIDGTDTHDILNIK